MGNPLRNEQLFVVRAWNENPGVIRGFIEHVESRQRVYFRDPREVGDVLALRLSIPIEEDAPKE